jgi:hypothetical protein
LLFVVESQVRRFMRERAHVSGITPQTEDVVGVTFVLLTKAKV